MRSRESERHIAVERQHERKKDGCAAGALGFELGFSTITMFPLKTCQTYQKKKKSWMCFGPVSLYWPKQPDFIGMSDTCLI